MTPAADRGPRDDAIMVEVAVPGQRWEVEFFEAGEVEVEKFLSDGSILDAAALEQLLGEFGESQNLVPDDQRS